MDGHKKKQPSVKETAGNRKTEKNKKQGKMKGAVNKGTSASSSAGGTSRKRQHPGSDSTSEEIISPRKLFVPASPSPAPQ